MNSYIAEKQIRMNVLFPKMSGFIILSRAFTYMLGSGMTALGLFVFKAECNTSLSKVHFCSAFLKRPTQKENESLLLPHF